MTAPEANVPDRTSPPAAEAAYIDLVRKVEVLIALGRLMVDQGTDPRVTVAYLVSSADPRTLVAVAQFALESALVPPKQAVEAVPRGPH